MAKAYPVKHPHLFGTTSMIAAPLPQDLEGHTGTGTGTCSKGVYSRGPWILFASCHKLLEVEGLAMQPPKK